MNFEVVAQDMRFPEGPAFDQKGRLWAVELEGGSLIRIGSAGIERIEVGGMPNGLAFWNDVAWFCDAAGRSIRKHNEDGTCATVVTAVEGVSPNRPNDLAFDRMGNLVFTCPGNSRHEPTGSVWCRRVNGDLVKIADGLYFPNGLAFEASSQSLIIAETYRHRLWKGDWNSATATWTQAMVWAQVGGPIGPDGMAFDTAGNLHVAIFDQGVIAEVGLDGSVLHRLVVDGKRPTNVAFDPNGKLGMVVTEAASGRILAYNALGPGQRLFDS